METTVHRLKREEGFSSEPYKCSMGYWSVGYGRNLETNPLTKEEQVRITGYGNLTPDEVKAHFDKFPISKKDATYLLQNDITKVTLELDSKIKNLETYPEAAISVLIDMAFNMGVGGLMKFNNFLEALKDASKLTGVLRKKKYEEASKHMLDSLWARQVGIRAKKLSEIIYKIK